MCFVVRFVSRFASYVQYAFLVRASKRARDDATTVYFI